MAKTIRLDDDMAEWLRRKAYERRCTQQALIDAALEAFREDVETLERAARR